MIVYGNQIFYINLDSQQFTIDKQQKVKFPITCASFRNDKQLIVAGDERGVIQIMITKTKSVIRKLYGSKTRINYCTFSNDGLKVYSGNVAGQLFVFNISLGNAIFAIQLPIESISRIIELQNDSLLVSTTSGHLYIVSIKKQIIQKGISEEKPLNDDQTPDIIKTQFDEQINDMILLSEENDESYILVQFKKQYKIIKISKENTEQKYKISDIYKSTVFLSDIINIVKISKQDSQKFYYIQYFKQDSLISQNYLQNNHLLIITKDGLIRDEQARKIYQTGLQLQQIGYYQDKLFCLERNKLIQYEFKDHLQYIYQNSLEQQKFQEHNFTIINVPKPIQKQNVNAAEYIFKSNYLKALEIALNDTQATTEAVLKELDKLHGNALEKAIQGCQYEVMKILLRRIKSMLTNEYMPLALHILQIIMKYQSQQVQDMQEFIQIKDMLNKYNDSIQYITQFQ